MDDRFRVTVENFFNAVKEHTLLIIIDSKSKGNKAVFSLVYYSTLARYYYTLSYLLSELGFRQSTDDDLFITYCAGRYSLFILDNIGIELKKRGVELPEWWYNEIQNQNVV